MHSQRTLCQCGCGEPAPIAKLTNSRRGHVAGRPVRFINGHQNRPPGPRWISEDRGYSTPCHIWQWARNAAGYGYNGGGFAHRKAWIAANGPLPDGLRVLHRCDVPACVNPEHLFVGTQAENVADMVAKRRSLGGTRNPSAKLTEDDVLAIRASHEPLGTLAKRYGVCKATVSDARTGRTWRHLAS